ncbi:uncharacterized protein LOC143145927 [Ptiloglossa arizonensis]|uniref:uncharacterized protein LOC143145927 n=1 Tax=Ptiloglossa arizonensis TaxID=3350558 RepID=UPI003F9F3E61
METFSIDLRATDRNERRDRLRGGSIAAGSTHEDAESFDPASQGKLERRFRGAMQPTQAEDRSEIGEGFPRKDRENFLQGLNLAYPKNKRNAGKKSAGRKRRVTFAV